MRNSKSWISSIISIAIIIIVSITVFVMKIKDTKGEKCYLDSTIIKKEYNLTFETDTVYYDEQSYYAVYIYITNNLTETQTFNFKKPYFKTDLDKKVTFKSLADNGFSLDAGTSDYYMLACPYSYMRDVKECLLHFKLNKYSFNLHTCLSTYKK